MKRPLVFTSTTKSGFKFLWIWRIAFIYCPKVDDERLHGIWRTKRAILVFINRKGIGIGHSFDIDNNAYMLDSH